MSNSMFSPDQLAHYDATLSLLGAINSFADQPFVLKGGTALLTCYGLDRFSEDIDLDAPSVLGSSRRFFTVLERWADQHGGTVRRAKDTATVKRALVHYSEENPAATIKVEASFRRREIPLHQTMTIDGIRTYTLDELCLQKCNAYLARDKIRDLYDVTWLCTQHFDDLSQVAHDSLQRVFEQKDLSHFDYVIAVDNDSLVDTQVLEERFLESFDRLGLLTPDRAKDSGKAAASVPEWEAAPDVFAQIRAGGVNMSRTSSPSQSDMPSFMVEDEVNTRKPPQR